jgi:hypothetical protein
MNAKDEELSTVRLLLLYIERFVYKESENERATSSNVSPEAETTQLQHELLDGAIFQPVIICFMNCAFSLPHNKLNNKITNQSNSQSTNQKANRLNNESTNQSTNQEANRLNNESTNQSTNQPNHQPTNQPTCCWSSYILLRHCFSAVT